jgi:predicted acyltransferase
VEVKGWRTGWTWPWIVFGSNAIAAYMFSELVPGIIYNLHLGAGHHETLASAAAEPLHHISNPGWAAFSYSVLFAAFCFIPVWILYRRKIFLKV